MFTVFSMSLVMFVVLFVGSTIIVMTDVCLFLDKCDNHMDVDFWSEVLFLTSVALILPVLLIVVFCQAMAKWARSKYEHYLRNARY